MNKYLKILALTGGALGCIAPTALRFDSPNSCNDLVDMYECVSNLQPIQFKLPQINRKLNITTSTSEGENDVTFTTHTEDGEEQELNNDETLTYLNSTLEQVNSEYEHLRETLTKAIKETMDYLDKAKENDSLTNEQKIYIKEHANSIKFLAETLENLSEDVLCCVDGIECDDCDTEEMTAEYLKIINGLEERINVLQNSLNSLQLINGIANPYFNRPHNCSPNTIIYGLKYGKRPSIKADSDLDINQDNVVNEVNEQDNEDTAVESNQSGQDGNEMDEQDSIEENAEDNYKTFNLKSNIDTYAPTKRNIDTFFNTALLDDEYGYGNMYGYGYGMPYGNMMYNGYGNPYGNMAYGEYNSNLVNRKVLEDNQTQIPQTSANVEKPEETPMADTNKARDKFKRVSNIDTYSGTTIKSNINSMGESKISRFIKDKFNSMKNKVRNKRQQTEDKMKDLAPIESDSNTEGMDDTYKYARMPNPSGDRQFNSNQDNPIPEHQSSQPNTNASNEAQSDSYIGIPQDNLTTDYEENIQTLPDFSDEREVADIPKIKKVDDIMARN